ncbi:MAG TPA: hypothetical protein VFV99_26470 [Kofleriaceae bacterium]|nr:hypothetical protein [Kofleriaceae bacterium]
MSRTLTACEARVKSTGPTSSSPMRRGLAGTVVLVSLVAAVVAALASPITRGPAFHAYADQRELFGIQHAGDVLSNLAFLAVGLWAMRRAVTPAQQAAASAVSLIAMGSAMYHFAPADITLALDWLGIGFTLGFVGAAVLGDRLGAVAEQRALFLTPILTLATIITWLVTGGTHGGTMTPYVAWQALGIVVPPLVALIAPGKIPRVPLLGAVALFALARLCAAHDAGLLDAIGVSGHSLKHVAAAGAAALALYAITSPASRAALSSS